MSERDGTREAYRHCEDLVRINDKDHFLAGLFAPPPQRQFLYALYAFALEIARIKMVVSDPLVGTIRLQWWREALSGSRAEEAAGNPVMSALLDASEKTAASLEPLTAAVEAREAELHGSQAPGAAAAVFMMAARFLGAQDGVVGAAADAAAKAVALVESEPRMARDAYAAFRALVDTVPEEALPAFLTVSLVPLRLKHPQAPQWRRQIALLRAAWFGFPKS